MSLSARTSAIAALIAIAMSPVASPAFATCEARLGLFKEALKLCAKDSSYCGDVPAYRAEAVAECGASTVAALGSEGGANPDDAGSNSEEPDGGLSTGIPPKGQQSVNSSDPVVDTPENTEQDLPRSCAYFTRPAYEPVRLNYHQIGSMVCWKDIAYECKDSSNGAKQWVARAPCSVFHKLQKACEFEGTC